MWIQQMFTTFLSILLVSQQILAVVNNAQTSSVTSDTLDNSTKTEEKTETSNNSNNVADSIVSSSEHEANRRDAPLSDTYGPPIPSETYGLPLTDSYLPPESSNVGLPIPIYGVPNGPSNNVIYPAPPPDLPPPLPAVSFTSSDLHQNNDNLIKDTYGPPKDVYGPPIESFRPPPPPSAKYGPPSLLPRLPKPYISIPFKSNKPFFGPPIKSHNSKPKPIYGPPKIQFRPQKQSFGPPKSTHGPPKYTNFNSNGYIGLSPPKNYGPPKFNHGSSQGGRYGPPDPVPHGPPHPGAPAPPTPPDIKYDGWQPIPGLVSRPPSGAYGTPNSGNHGGGDLQLNVDFSPPHFDISHNSGSFQSGGGHQTALFAGGNYGLPSDSYGAPLNTVTGSGGIIGSAGDQHEEHPGLSLGLATVGINGGHDDSLSVIKSIGYELYLNNGAGGFSDGSHIHSHDTYSAPPLSSYSVDGPYAAAHSYNSHGASFDTTLNTHGISSGGDSSYHGLSLSTSGIGLIPPSGVYGVPPSGHYGTPLLSPPRQQHAHPLNALEINPPRHPVVFREPVPNGLIESIGHHVAQKDAHGIIEHTSSYHGGPTYIPPPIPDITKPVKEEPLPEPSNLFSLPVNGSPISFQNVVHESSSAGLGDYATGSFDFNGHSGHIEGAGTAALTSYAAPLGTIDGSYSLLDSGQVTVGLDHSHAASTIDLTGNNFASSLPVSYGTPAVASFQHIGHDCSLHKSQPLPVPQLSYGVPSANSYTASLSSLTTNIGGNHHELSNYAASDLQTAHSQSNAVTTNAIETKQIKDNYAKSLAANFAPGGQLIKSQSIDLNNIPVQGSLGSYTLQIQSADSLGSSSSPHIPHEQLLNDGLLRSILAAIEQPRQNIEKQREHQQQNFHHENYNNGQGQLTVRDTEDIEGQQSVKNAVVVTPSPQDSSSSFTLGSTTQSVTPRNETNEDIPSIENNEIALYFNNNNNKRNAEESAINVNLNKDSNNKILNGQQYGNNYVSFKTPRSSFVYGDFKLTDADASTIEVK